MLYRVFICCLFLVAATTVDNVCDAKARVFFLGGQSNMSGHGDGDDLTGPLSIYAPPQADVNIWRSYQDEGNVPGTDNTWSPLAPEKGDFYALRNDPNLGSREPSFGPEVSFGRAIADAFPDDDIYLVKHAWGATSLAGGWNPVIGKSTGVMTGSNTTPGLQYNLFTAAASAALADLDSANIDYEISGMLWLQGESDAINGSTDAAYEANLRDFIDTIRDDYNDEDLPFLIARINPQWGGPNSATRAAQQQVADDTEGVYWFDTDDLVPPSGNVHFNSAGQIEIGLRFASTYTNIEPPLPDPGDTDNDGDIDTADLTTAIINFNGAEGTGKDRTDGDTDDDGDVDTVDLTYSIINFTGALPSDPVLIYESATGNVSINTNGLDVISFNLAAGPFMSADFSELPPGLTDNISTDIGWTSFNLFSGLVGSADLGAILPAGLDLTQVESAMTIAEYGLSLSEGGGGGQFDIILNPEPSSILMIGASALALLRRRHAVENRCNP